MTLKQFFSAAAIFICMPLAAFGARKTWSLSSPDGRIVTEVRAGDGWRKSQDNKFRLKISQPADLWRIVFLKEVFGL